jgi:hypothetical protein
VINVLDRHELPTVARLRARALERLTGGRHQFLFSVGCGCCGGCKTTICCISPCVASDGASGFGASGVTVTVSNSSGTIAQGTTPSGPTPSGCVVLNIPASGSYIVTTSGNARYLNTSQTVTLNCGATVGINLTSADGFTCTCLANEPISANLLFIGGSGTVTLPSDVGAFTLPASVSVLNSDNFGACNGTITEDPCSTGSGTLEVNFTFGCGTIQESWCASTDCTTNVNDQTCGPFDFYFPVGDGGSCANAQIEQWGTGLDCFGYCAQTGLSNATFPVPATVPINIVVTLPPNGSPLGPAASNPPITTITITEDM